MAQNAVKAGWKSRVPGALVVLALTLPALWPLFRPGFFVSDDGLFHVYRIAALADAWAHGVLYPRLFPEFGFGYGQAVLSFYAPLSYAPGAALALLGAGPVIAARLTIALGFLLAALAAYGFGRAIWGVTGGVLAAVAYTYFPYHLADAYVRGAIPEHFAFIWLPLILWSLTAVFRADDARPAALAGALAWTGLLFTHNLTALLMIPAAALYLAALGLWTGRWQRLGWVAVSLLLAALLSAPLWLPFLAESGGVGIALGPSDGYRRHLAPIEMAFQWTPLYRYRGQPGTAADHPLPWTSVALVLTVAALAGWRILKKRLVHAGWLVAYFLALTIGSAFMITAPALPIWLPFEDALAQLQYPWRFLTLTAVGVMGLAGSLPALADTEEADRRSWLPWLLPMGVAAALIVQPLANLPAAPLALTAAEAWAPDRMWREDAEVGQVGATWTAEFLPLTVKEQRWALGRPKEGAADGSALQPQPKAQIVKRAYGALELQVESAAPLALRLHQFHLPAWRALLDGQPAPTYPSGDLGLVAADALSGSTRAAFRFGPAPDWIAAGLLATAGAVGWSALAWRGRRGHYGRALTAGAVALPVAALLLALNGAGVGQRTWTPRLPVGGPATVGDVALLIGFDSVPARGERALDVTLYWFALRETGANYKTFVHVLDGNGQVVAQHDGDPGGGFTPTTRWMPYEVVPDRHRLTLPEGSPGGTVGLRAGMYALEESSAPVNLPVSPVTSDGRVDLGTVEVAPP